MVKKVSILLYYAVQSLFSDLILVFCYLQKDAFFYHVAGPKAHVPESFTMVFVGYTMIFSF